MKTLIACEESQAVTIEFRALGHEAYSCDILPCSGGHPEWHLQKDVAEVLKEKWDMVIAFPPCTHLAVSGAAHFAKKRADGRQQQGIDFFMEFTKLNCAYAIENPVGIMSKIWRKPNQIIQPWQFGDSFQKQTCLWLNELPKLTPTNIVNRGEFKTYKDGSVRAVWFNVWGSKNVNLHNYRSKTFPGIAKAMAMQWGSASCAQELGKNDTMEVSQQHTTATVTQ